MCAVNNITSSGFKYKKQIAYKGHLLSLYYFSFQKISSAMKMMMFFQGLMTLLRMIEKHIYVGKVTEVDYADVYVVVLKPC